MPGRGHHNRLMADGEEWERLARLLDDDDEAVAVAVRQAVEQGDDPWAALLDGLDEAGALAYLQSGDTGMELTDALAQLPRVFAKQPDLDDATDTDDLAEATRIADAALAEHDLRIVRLVEDDESWPLVVVPEGRVREILTAVTALGESVAVIERARGV